MLNRLDHDDKDAESRTQKTKIGSQAQGLGREGSDSFKGKIQHLGKGIMGFSGKAFFSFEVNVFSRESAPGG